MTTFLTALFYVLGIDIKIGPCETITIIADWLGFSPESFHIGCAVVIALPSLVFERAEEEPRLAALFACLSMGAATLMADISIPYRLLAFAGVALFTLIISWTMAEY